MDKSGPGEISDLSPDFLPEALNSPLPRSASFTALVEKEGSTDPFFKLLDSPSKNTEMP
jgi:hypothetical protein